MASLDQPGLAQLPVAGTALFFRAESFMEVKRRSFIANLFCGEVGNGGRLVDHLLEGNRVLLRNGVDFKTCLLTGHRSERPDRVVAEWEADSAGDREAGLARAMASPQAQAEMGVWMEKLNGLIHYAEGEYWQVRRPGSQPPAGPCCSVL